MDGQNQQIMNSLRQVLERATEEYDVTYVEALGMLEALKLEIWETLRAELDSGSSS